jgi:hypothetical protein
MYTIILFALVAVIGYFGIKASRYGALSVHELPIFAILCVGLSGYLIFLIYKLVA